MGTPRLGAKMVLPYANLGQLEPLVLARGSCYSMALDRSDDHPAGMVRFGSGAFPLRRIGSLEAFNARVAEVNRKKARAAFEARLSQAGLTVDHRLAWVLHELLPDTRAWDTGEEHLSVGLSFCSRKLDATTAQAVDGIAPPSSWLPPGLQMLGLLWPLARVDHGAALPIDEVVVDLSGEQYTWAGPPTTVRDWALRHERTIGDWALAAAEVALNGAAGDHPLLAVARRVRRDIEKAGAMLVGDLLILVDQELVVGALMAAHYSAGLSASLGEGELAFCTQLVGWPPRVSGFHVRRRLPTQCWTFVESEMCMGAGFTAPSLDAQPGQRLAGWLREGATRIYANGGRFRG